MSSPDNKSYKQRCIIFPKSGILGVAFGGARVKTFATRLPVCLQQIHHTRVAAGQASDKECIHSLHSFLADCEARRLGCAISDDGVVTKAREIRVEDPEAVAIHIQLTSIFPYPQGPLGPFYALLDQCCCHHGETDSRVHVTTRQPYDYSELPRSFQVSQQEYPDSPIVMCCAESLIFTCSTQRTHGTQVEV